MMPASFAMCNTGPATANGDRPNKPRSSARREPLSQLDASPHRIENVCDLQPVQLRHHAIGCIEGHAVGFQLLAERFQVRYLEADVIERSALRWRTGRVGLAEVDFTARNHGRYELAALAGRGTESLHIPRAHAFRISGHLMDVMEGDRNF